MLRRTALLSLLCAVTIAGCATSPQARKQSQVLEVQVGRAVAVDSIDTINSLYPPAKMQLTLVRPVVDEFGQSLVAGLRARGYAVVEPDPAVNGRKRFAQAKATAAKPGSDSGIPFDYKIAQVGDVSLYEVVIMVGSNRLARAYMLNDKRVNPVGEWTRRE
jgi:hypothetical protein